MLIKRRTVITILALILVSFVGTMFMGSAGQTTVYCKAKEKAKRVYECYAGDFVSTGGIDFEVDKTTVNKNYNFHAKVGDIFKIKFETYSVEKSSDFKVGLLDEDGQKISCRLKVSKNGKKTKTLTVSKEGVYQFYFCPKKANCKDGSVSYDFVIGIKKNK